MTQGFPAWDANVVQGVADVLGATDTGLSGSEIGRLLVGHHELDHPRKPVGCTRDRVRASVEEVGLYVNDQQRRRVELRCREIFGPPVGRPRRTSQARRPLSR